MTISCPIYLNLDHVSQLLIAIEEAPEPEDMDASESLAEARKGLEALRDRLIRIEVAMVRTDDLDELPEAA